MICRVGLLAGLFVSTSIATAQSNVVSGTDVEMGLLSNLASLGRVGDFPTGTNAFAMSTTSCNKGSVDVPWETADTGNPMQDDHPYIAFLLAREAAGRLEQISDYSHVKHGFFALADSQCDTCTLAPFGAGDVLGVGCSDTYNLFNNGDDYWLGPAEEIDPWLGLWDPFGSYFDRGDPQVPAPANTDGLRSLSNRQVSSFDPVGNRIHVRDEDLNDPEAVYYYQGYYVIRGEPEADRWNNFRTRRFTPVWAGSIWQAVDEGPNFLGSILEQWSGAQVGSAPNGTVDGRVYVAGRVTGPVDGLYHYEYAVHNRDAHRKVGAFEVPLCAAAQVANVEFRDIDQDTANDWSAVVEGGSLRWSTDSNPIRWNSFYNFSFDTDAAPREGRVVYDPFDPGPGLEHVTVGGLQVPLGLYNVHVGEGCSFTTPPSLFALGTPPQATLGNATFALASAGNDALAPVLPFVGLIPGEVDLGAGCTLFSGGAVGAGLIPLAVVAADAAGIATIPLSIPADPALEGLQLGVQALGFRTGGGPIAGSYDLSDAVRVRVGDELQGCPGGN